MYCTLAPITIAERLGTPVIFAPQSIGPFGHKRQRRCAQRALQGASLVLVREDVSYELVESLGVNPRRCAGGSTRHLRSDPVPATVGASSSH